MNCTKDPDRINPHKEDTDETVPAQRVLTCGKSHSNSLEIKDTDEASASTVSFDLCVGRFTQSPKKSNTWKKSFDSNGMMKTNGFHQRP